MFVNDNKIKSVRAYFREKLKDSFDNGEIRYLTNLSLESVLGKSKTDLLLMQEETVSESDLLKFRSIIKDLLSQKPIQYILGETEFCGLNILVNESVLIPRPETEELISIIQSDQKELSNILDIGTGSGCIPLALKNSFPDSKVNGMDVSEEALKVARSNAKGLNLQVDFVLDSILDPTTDFQEPFDLIVSNPPYVLESDKADMFENVLKHEPHLALFVPDDDPLLFYKAILKFSEKNLKEGAWLYFEIHEDSAIQIKQLFLDAGYDFVEIHQDFYGKDRIVKGRK